MTKNTTGDLFPVAEVVKNLPAVKPLSATDLRIIEAATSVDPQQVLYQHTVFCQACLPYRNPGPNVHEWQRDNGNLSLFIEALKVRASEDPKDRRRLGIPFGPKARLILGDWNTQAILTQSPQIDIEHTLTSFVKRLELAPHGRNIRAVKTTLAQLCAAHLSFTLPTPRGSIRHEEIRIAGAFELWPKDDLQQRPLWPEWVRLNTDYFRLLLEHGVPLDEAHYVALSHNAMAMDIYAWLAQRLHRIKAGSVLVSWQQLQLQFGWNIGKLFNFRRIFKVALGEVLTVYRVAKVEASSAGLILRNSPPPVLKTQILLP